MNFQQAGIYLLNQFQQHSFADNVRNNKRHVSQIVVEKCTNGTEIFISFPGYKAKIIESSGKIVFDYRANIHKNGINTALSHANIITDIYNKIVHGKMNGQELRKALVNFFREGASNLSVLYGSLPYTAIDPDSELLARVRKAHLQKPYNLAGNAFDLSLEELFCSLKWIVLQEDINYPIANGFEGRKMPLARYLETIFVAENDQYTLEDVIQRALSHSKPALWPELKYPFKTR